METNYPKVGIGVIVMKEGKILIGKRKGSHASNTYSFPGGHLDYMESFEDCARRETMEECGIKIKNIRFLHVVNSKEFAPKHYINIELIADWESGEPQSFPGERIGDWEWCSVDELPQPLFSLSMLGIESLKTGKNYFDNL